MLQYFNLLNNVKSTEYLIAKRNNKIASNTIENELIYESLNLL